MKLAIMQPYFLPYIGYFQLMRAVDTFVIYDDVKYTKKGWINRNQFLHQGKQAYFSIPLKKASDALCIRDRAVADDFNKGKLLNKVKEAYRKAPYFAQTMAFFERVLLHDETNLFRYVLFSIQEVCRELRITPRVIVSSSLGIDPSLKAQDKVISICRNIGADVYINATGGRALYSVDTFARHSIALRFLESGPVAYRQLGHDFVPRLSILDVMMFNSADAVAGMLSQYELQAPAESLCSSGGN